MTPSPAATSAPISGHCDPRFERVRDAFATNFDDPDDPELGGGVAVRLDGRGVVDLWGGHLDEEGTQPWCKGTLVNAYSVGKGVLAILALACVEAGKLDLDATVASLWPEFAAEGKDKLTVRGLLAHRSGLPGVREPLDEFAMYDWAHMCDVLARQAPFWEPGHDHGYHVNTYGYLVGEVLRRATGSSVSELLLRHVTGPIEADYYWGVPAKEHSRISPAHVPQVILSTPEQWSLIHPPSGDAERDKMVWRSYFNPARISGMGAVNTAAWREAVIPSTNGHTHARAVAAIYAAHLAGGSAANPLAGASLRAEATRIHSDGIDRILGKPSRFGLGFQLAQPTRPLGPNPAAYGHFGYGGTLGLADPDAGLAFGFVTNRPGERWQTPRTRRLLEAVYACL